MTSSMTYSIYHDLCMAYAWPMGYSCGMREVVNDFDGRVNVGGMSLNKAVEVYNDQTARLKV